MKPGKTFITAYWEITSLICSEQNISERAGTFSGLEHYCQESDLHILLETLLAVKSEIVQLKECLQQALL
jgi:hypothetical protein